MASDIQNAVALIWNQFLQLERTDATAKRLLDKINSGKASYDDLQKFSSWMSANLVKLAGANYPEDSQAVLDALRNSTVCRNYFAHLDRAVNTVQKSMNQAAGIGLQPVKIRHPSQLVDAELTASDDYHEDMQRFTGSLAANSQKHVDLTELANAKFQSKAGCRVTVTRIYDSVGLRNGKQPCEWCLARTGTDVPYREAVARGMFERHDGCGCTIIYHSGKETTVQRWKGGRESWASEAQRNRRIQFSNSDINEKVTVSNIDFYTGPNGKTMLAKYRQWIGDNKMQEVLSSCESDEAKKVIRTDFRKTSYIGDGDTVSIREFEIATGLKCGRAGGDHSQKVGDLIRQTRKVLLKDIPENDRLLLEKKLESLLKVNND